MARQKRQHTQKYDVRPQVKQRPRMTRRGKAYTPIKTHLAENVIGEGWTGPKYEGPVFMRVIFDKTSTEVTVGFLSETDYPKTALRGDIDNYLKLVMDGLNGVAYDDDSQVRHIEVTKK